MKSMTINLLKLIKQKKKQYAYNFKESMLLFFT